MTDTIISPDGTMMWTGTEWIPLPGHEGGDDADDPSPEPLSPEMENLKRLERLIEGAEEKLSEAPSETHDPEPVPESPQYPPAEQTGRAWVERPWWQLGSGPLNRQPVGAEEKEELYILAKEKFGEIEEILSYSDALINRKSKDQARLPEAVKCLLEIQDIFLHTLDRRLLVSIQETQSYNPLGIKTKIPNPTTNILGTKCINMYTNLCILFKSPPSRTSKIMVSGITNFRFLKCRKYDKEAAADPMLPSWSDMPDLRKMVSESMEKIMAVAPDTIPIHQAKPGSSQLQEAMHEILRQVEIDD